MLAAAANATIPPAQKVEALCRQLLRVPPLKWPSFVRQIRRLSKQARQSNGTLRAVFYYDAQKKALVPLESPSIRLHTSNRGDEMFSGRIYRRPGPVLRRVLRDTGIMAPNYAGPYAKWSLLEVDGNRAVYDPGLNVWLAGHPMITVERSDEVWLPGSDRPLSPEGVVLDADGRIATFADGATANIMGATVLAMTADGRVLLQYTSQHNTMYAGRIAASAAGSADWTGLHTGTDLVGFVREGMRHELTEELGLATHPPLSAIKMIGFARITERGGAPEFSVSQSSALEYSRK